VLERYNATFLFSVYDEINFSVDRADAVEFIREVHGVMTERYADFEISFESSIELGPNFGNLKSIGVKFDEVKIRELL
jgi:hypothetical protein